MTSSDPAPAQDATVTNPGTPTQASHVPVPPGGVRGADQVDDMDPQPGEGTTTGADGQTPAREELRKDLGERPSGADEEPGGVAGSLEQTAALGATDDPEGGSIQPGGSDGRG